MRNIRQSFLNYLSSCWVLGHIYCFIGSLRFIFCFNRSCSICFRSIVTWCWVNLCIISKRMLMFTINKISENIFMVLHLLYNQWWSHLERDIILLVFGCWFKTSWVYWINLAKCRFTEHVMIVLFFLSVFRWRHSYMISSFCRFYLILVEFWVLWFFWSKVDIWCGLMINVCNSFLNYLSSCWVFFWVNLYIIPKRVLKFTINKLSEKIFMILLLLWDQWRFHL